MMYMHQGHMVWGKYIYQYISMHAYIVTESIGSCISLIQLSHSHASPALQLDTLEVSVTADRHA